MIEYIIKDVAGMLCFLPDGMIVGAVTALLLGAINKKRTAKNKKNFSVPALTSFVTYMVIVLFITFLSRENGDITGMDLVLFSTWGINTRNNALVVENILLFIPYGFVSAWVFKPLRKFILCTLWGFLSSLCIETIQLITGRGFFQIDDIITNTAGAIVGLAIFTGTLAMKGTATDHK